MPTTVLATALPHSLADDAPFQLTVFVTHKLVDGPPRCALGLPGRRRLGDHAGRMHARRWTTSLDPNAALPLRVVSDGRRRLLGGGAAADHRRCTASRLPRCPARPGAATRRAG